MVVGDEQQQNVHVFMVPFQAEGHVNGLLRLAEALAAQPGVNVTFAYPARFYALRRTSAEAMALPNLRLQTVEDGLPLQEEELLTAALLLASIPVFEKTVANLLLEDVLMKQTRICILSDVMVPWTQTLAESVGLPRFAFWTSTAASFSMSSHLDLLIANAHIPIHTSCWVEEKRWKVEAPLVECVPGLAPFPITDLPSEFVEAQELANPCLQVLHAACESARQARAVLVHSVYELEKEVFDALQDRGFSVYPVGPLLLSSVQRPIQNTHVCLQWLDMQAASSVIYIALGTVSQLSPKQMHSLALGLELSGHPFLWVIRSDMTCTTSLSNTLPQGFLERSVAPAGSGIIMPWVPQTDVLRHRSIGAFFSHCGWNSTLESMWEGVPIVACPLCMEQRSNARGIVKTWRMGVELERQVDGSFTKESVQKALEEVFHPSYKKAALLAKKVARDTVQNGGISHSNLLHFVDLLHQLGKG